MFKNNDYNKLGFTSFLLNFFLAFCNFQILYFSTLNN